MIFGFSKFPFSDILCSKKLKTVLILSDLDLMFERHSKISKVIDVIDWVVKQTKLEEKFPKFCLKPTQSGQSSVESVWISPQDRTI